MLGLPCLESVGNGEQDEHPGDANPSASQRKSCDFSCFKCSTPREQDILDIFGDTSRFLSGAGVSLLSLSQGPGLLQLFLSSWSSVQQLYSLCWAEIFKSSSGLCSLQASQLAQPFLS